MLAYDFTTDDGWHYAGTAPIPDVRWTFSRDISSSPPGKARLAASASGTPLVVTSWSPPDNPGRSNGPTSGVSPPTLEFATVGLQVDSIKGPGIVLVQDATITWGCGMKGTSAIDGHSNAYVCTANKVGDAGMTTIDRPEAEIDEMVSMLNTRAPTLNYVAGPPYHPACVITVTPSSQATVSDPACRASVRNP